MAPPKPRLRGWLHLVTTPLALVGGLVLTAKGTTYANRLAVAVFTATACLMFGTSAMYHLGTWPPRALRVLRRMDLANIALIIAGTYTPIAVAILPRTEAEVLLWVVWVAAIAHRGLERGWARSSTSRRPGGSTPGCTSCSGWAAVFWFPELLALRRRRQLLPHPARRRALHRRRRRLRAEAARLSPRTFGFHELFHACTVAAFACHFIVVARVAC